MGVRCVCVCVDEGRTLTRDKEVRVVGGGPFHSGVPVGCPRPDDPWSVTEANDPRAPSRGPRTSRIPVGLPGTPRSQSERGRVLPTPGKRSCDSSVLECQWNSFREEWTRRVGSDLYRLHECSDGRGQTYCGRTVFL